MHSYFNFFKRDHDRLSEQIIGSEFGLGIPLQITETLKNNSLWDLS
jgi:hypothetical protein